MRVFIGILAAFLVVSMAEAQEPPPFAPAFAPAFALAIDAALRDVILPNHQAFFEAAAAMVDPIETLCAHPSTENLTQAQMAFGGTVLAWSAVELYRFGPARDENRFEKLFYWPDRKGRGLRQVQKVLATEDATVLKAETLGKKSVAVQGLPALEFVLFGSQAEALATGNPFRCAYASALSQVIAAHAKALLDGWQNESGYGAAMTRAGQEGSPYRSHGEVVQDLIKAAAEQLQIIGDLKILPALGETSAKAKPKRAPFWRSDLTRATLRANVNAAEHLLARGIGDLVAQTDANLPKALAFELTQVQLAIHRIDGNWVEMASSEQGHQTLAYARIPLASATRLVEVDYPAALGLVLGFNSLDGD